MCLSIVLAFQMLSIYSSTYTDTFEKGYMLFEINPACC